MSSNGIIYAVMPNGKLRWWKHTAFQTGADTWEGGIEFGSGWDVTLHVFSAGDGIIYAVMPNGKLRWWKHTGYQTGADTWEGGNDLGEGWDVALHVFSPGDGIIYAVMPTGKLRWWKHTGYQTGANTWEGGNDLGEGWDVALHVFANESGGQSRAQFLYYNAGTGAAATGQIDEGGNHTTLKGYPAGAMSTGWTHIAATHDRLLFYNAATGAAATGMIDTAGNHTTLRSYPNGAFSGGWTHINASGPYKPFKLPHLEPIHPPQPIRVQLLFNEIRAGWTTERGGFSNPGNTRDEVYFVVAGVSGSKKAKRKISIPRVSPAPPQDYFEFENETIRNDVALIDFIMKPGDMALVNIMIREQDNAQRSAIFDSVEAAAAGVYAFFTGDPTAFEFAKEKAKTALKEFYDSLKTDGDQNIGGFGVHMSYLDGHLKVEWSDGPATLITSQDGPSATFEAEDSDANYTGRVSARILPWQLYQLESPGLASTSGGISAVSRRPDHMEIFWIGGDGSVWDAHWYESLGRWDSFQLAPPGLASTSGGISAVSRRPDHMEIFWIGGDGSVWDAHWYEGFTKWELFQLALPGLASTSGGISAVSRRPDHMEIFWIGGDGSVWDAHWYEGFTQWTLFQLAPPELASTSGGITAVSRIRDSMEVWWIGGDGSIWDAFWYPTTVTVTGA